MDLSTTYLGLPLSSPLMPGASPLAADMDTVKRLEDAGASAIVMHSLFEEQITGEPVAAMSYIDDYPDAGADDAAPSYFPRHTNFRCGPDEYLDQLQRIKQAVSVPVIASLNGSTPGGWTEYARLLQDGGADALELNVYHVATDLFETSAAVEGRVLEAAALIRRAVTIPVAVKLSPFYSSLPNLARQLDDLGVDGLVLFNRFYQPDLDLNAMSAVARLYTSRSSDLLLRLRWIAILAGRVDASLALTGGVHTGQDALKAAMAGADAVQVVSALLHHGPEYLRTLREGMSRWLNEHEYESLHQVQGSLSLERCRDPRAFERGNYMRVLQSWRPPTLSWPRGYGT